jgi:hypothetical protein
LTYANGRMSHVVHINTLGHIITPSLVSTGTPIRAKTNVFIYPINNSVCMIRCYGEDIGEFRPAGRRGRKFECFEPSTEPRRHWEQLYRSTSRSLLVSLPTKLPHPLPGNSLVLQEILNHVLRSNVVSCTCFALDLTLKRRKSGND